MAEIASAASLVPSRSAIPRTLDGAVLLSGATVASGIFAYAYHVLAARALGPHAYGLVAVLWAAMFLAVIVLFRPLEQTASRALANRIARGDEVRSVFRALLVLYGTITVALLVGIGATWNLLRDGLFLGDSALVVALVVGVVAYGAAYLVRGICGGLHWFKGYALLLVSDGAVRLLVAAPLLVLAASPHLAGAAQAAAAVGGAALPLLVGRRIVRRALAQRDGVPFHCGSALAFAVPAGVIAAADQVLVNSAPLLVMVEGGKDASQVAGLVFAATMLVRIPVFVFQGLATSLLPNLTRLHAIDEPALFRQAVLRAGVFLAACTVVIVAGAAALGPASMQWVYGSDYVTGRLELALLGVGVGCYMATSTFSQALLALDRGRIAAAGWTLSAGLFLLLYFALSGDALFRVAASFAIATAVSVILLTGALARQVGFR